MTYNNSLIIVTDASVSAKSSTTREVNDLLIECKKENIQTLIMAPRQYGDDVYTVATSGIYFKPFFYKSHNRILRFFSENIMGLTLAFKCIKDRKKYKHFSNVLWISPSVFNIYAVLTIKLLCNVKVYLMMRDIFPYWLARIGLLAENSFLYKFLNLFTALQIKVSDVIGVESKSSHVLFSKLYADSLKKTEVLNNWMTVHSDNFNKKNVGKIIRFIYTGNIGYAQGIDRFVEFINHCKFKKNIEIHIFARGDFMNNIINLVENNKIFNVFIHNQIPFDEIDLCISEFDVGLVFLAPNIGSSNIPGKSMGYLLNGLPIFGSVNIENDLPQLITENNFGQLDVSGNTKQFLYSADLFIENYLNGFYPAKTIAEKSKLIFSTSKALKQILI